VKVSAVELLDSGLISAGISVAGTGRLLVRAAVHSERLGTFAGGSPVSEEWRLSPVPEGTARVSGGL
jgi:hypothetical protein